MFTVDFSKVTSLTEEDKALKDVEIKDSYPHEQSPSVFVMWDARFQVHWSYSGNELRRIYLEDPDFYITGPIEVPISKGTDQIFTNLYDGF